MEYFTPLIEDIRVGYEFEVFLTSPKDKQGSWKIRNYKGKWVDDNVAFDYYLKNNKIRVPYLTKEQIEAEGWKWDSKLPYPNFRKKDCFLEISYAQDKTSVHIHYGEGTSLFDGLCKDINTFRYICKLLGI